MVRLVWIGLAAGFFSALFGVGGGIVLVPLLVLVLGFGERLAMGTSLGAIGITALAGVIFYAFYGRVEPGYGALIGIPAAFGAAAGTWIQQRVPRRALSIAFATLLVAIAIKLVVG